MDSDSVREPESDVGATNPFTRDRVEWPAGPNLVRQIVIVVAAIVVWGGVFRVAMNLPTQSADDIAAEARRTERRQASMANREEADSTDQQAAGEPSAPSTAAESTETPRPATSSPTTVSDPAASIPTSTVAPTATANASAPATEPDAPAPTILTMPEIDPIAAMEEETDFASQLPDLTDLPTVSFASDVLPIIERRCVKCHGEAREDGSLRIEEGLDLRSWEAIMAGSTWGSVVEPGDPVASYMLEMVLKGDMPDDGPRLLPGEIRILTAWIQAGAQGNQQD